MKSATCKSVRDLPVKARLDGRGVIIVEQKLNGILFTFPAISWPVVSFGQREWVERLTPWWDIFHTEWTPQCHRLRESCVKSINAVIKAASL